MEYPELLGPMPPDGPLPENYEKLFPILRVVRIRRGALSATILLEGHSRLFAARRGAAVLEAVRLASAFFGKGQFVPQRSEPRQGAYRLWQELQRDYLQPLDPPRRVSPSDWAAARAWRRRSEICRLTQQATVTELADGFRLRLQAFGTDHVPVAVEINLREGGRLEGVEAVAGVGGAWVLAGEQAVYRVGNDVLRFGPGLARHRYVQVRGAEAKLPGPCVYLTSYTPFDHTIEFRWTQS